MPLICMSFFALETFENIHRHIHIFKKIIQTYCFPRTTITIFLFEFNKKNQNVNGFRSVGPPSAYWRGFDSCKRFGQLLAPPPPSIIDAQTPNSEVGYRSYVSRCFSTTTTMMMMIFCTQCCPYIGFTARSTGWLRTGSRREVFANLYCANYRSSGAVGGELVLRVRCFRGPEFAFYSNRPLYCYDASIV